MSLKLDKNTTKLVKFVIGAVLVLAWLNPSIAIEFISTIKIVLEKF